MARNTSDDLAKIITTALDVAPYLSNADVLVTSIESESGYSASQLKFLELYLAAHFICISDPSKGAESEVSTEGVTRKFMAVGGDGLKSTRYGQQVFLADLGGFLSRDVSPSVRGRKASIRAI